MKIKRYTQFIKESLKEDIEEGKLWKLSEDEIREYMLEITDAGYLVTITFGFCEKQTRHYYNRPSIEKDVFTEKVRSGDDVRPAYWIQIEKGRNIKNDDVSSTFQFVCSIVSEETNSEISILDSEGDLGDIDGIVIKGGLFYTDNWNSSDPEILESDDYIAIFAKQKETITVNTKQLVDFYGWNVDVEKEGKIWAEIDLEDLADKILRRGSNYKDSLVKGQEHMWDYYEMHYYEPEINNLFSYTLEKETKELLAKALIKEFGGFDEVKNWEKNNTTSSKNSFPKDFQTEEELVDFFVNERNNELLKKWIESAFSDSEVYREVTDTVANWEMSAHCDDNYKEIVDDFEDTVRDDVGSFEKVIKEVNKHYTRNDGSRVEYKSDVTYYQFPYSNEWIEDVDSDYLYNRDLDDIFRDWLDEQNHNYELNPRLSDYGSVDDKKMNLDIRSYLKRYLEREK